MTRKQKRRTEKRRRHGRVALGAAAAIGAAGTVAGPAQAADFIVLNTGDLGAGTLRQAIAVSNATPSVADRILFQTGLSGDINLNSSLPQITSPLDIVGPGTALAVDGQGSYRPFSVADNLRISGLTIKDGYAVYCNPCVGTTNGGGAIGIVSGNTVTVENVDFKDSVAGGNSGAAIYAGPSSDLTVRDSTFTGNRSDLEGGAIYVKAEFGQPSTASISGSDFSGNGAGTAPYYSQNGGAVAARGTDGSIDLDITTSTFTRNKAGRGGAVYASRTGNVTIGGSSFSGNEATYVGGGAALNGQFSVDGSVFTGNQSEYAAAGLHANPQDGPSSVSDSTFSGNTAGGSGGAIGAAGTSRLRLRNLTVSGNQARGTAGGIFSYSESLEMDSLTVSGNTVLPETPGGSTVGGGIFQADGPAELNNSIVSGNTAATGPDLGGSVAAPGSPAGRLETTFSLIGNATGAPIDDIVPGSNLIGVDPQLGPLADNGGSTMTRLPATTSPAINKGGSNLDTDQRGLTRPVDFNSIPFSTAAGANGADIGAVELQGGPLPPSNNFTFGKVKLNQKKGIATLQVKVPGAGKVVLVGSKTVPGQKKTAKSKATIGLTVKAKGKAAKTLKKQGKVTVKAKVTFTPTGGKAKTKSKTVKLVR